ncbi:MAG: CDP-alcohol phosphatidyltransferase family protein [Gammaproteobacteria bacterium]|nr:CDP-alcohol phosphatidyltransferase family protein [Gammaproteobacteria bacterium]
MKARHIPNLISILRVLLVVPLAFFLLSKSYLMAFGLFFLAGISDALDGYLARRFNWSSHLGALLDPVGDKLLMITSYLILGGQEHLPIWLVVTVILRDVIIVTGGLAYRVMIGEVVIEPIFSSKINTVLQISLMAVVLFSLSIVTIPVLIIQLMIYLVLMSTVVSGTCYMILWGQRAIQSHTSAEKEGME